VRRFFAAVVILIVGTGVLLALRSPYESLVDELILVTLGEDTLFAPDYSDKALQQLSIGDSETRVLELLGEPLIETDGRRTDAGTTCMHYSRSPTSTHFRKRVVCLENGKVSRTIAELYFD